MPPIFLEFSFFLAVDERLHAMVVQRIRLDQIYYIKLVDDVFAGVGDSEEEPLTELGRRSVVELQFQVIFEFSNLGCAMQIATFKSRFKYEGHVTVALQVVVLTQSIVVPSVYHLPVYRGGALDYLVVAAQDLLPS